MHICKSTRARTRLCSPSCAAGRAEGRDHRATAAVSYTPQQRPRQVSILGAARRKMCLCGMLVGARARTANETSVCVALNFAASAAAPVPLGRMPRPAHASEPGCAAPDGAHSQSRSYLQPAQVNFEKLADPYMFCSSHRNAVTAVALCLVRLPR